MRLSKKIKRFAKRGQISTGKLTVFLQESIQGNRIVKAFGMEQYEIQRFAKENSRLFKQSLRASRVRGIVTPMMDCSRLWDWRGGMVRRIERRWRWPYGR
jgi:subfamily B ATP-binding cassette protein MsbA